MSVGLTAAFAVEFQQTVHQCVRRAKRRCSQGSERTGTLINQASVRMRFESERNGSRLSRPQPKIIETMANRHHANPGWRICSSRSHCILGPRVRQLSNHLRRRYQLHEELPHDTFGLDLHEIVQRRAVGDALHRPISLRSVAICSPNSSAVMRSSVT